MDRAINQSIKQWIKQWMDHAVGQSIKQSINPSINKSFNQASNRSINGSTNLPINQSFDPRTNASNNQSKNQSTNPSINQSIVLWSHSLQSSRRRQRHPKNKEISPAPSPFRGTPNGCPVGARVFLENSVFACFSRTVGGHPFANFRQKITPGTRWAPNWRLVQRPFRSTGVAFSYKNELQKQPFT